MTIFYSPRFQALNTSGIPMPGALLYTYTAGTSTLKNTYSDEPLTIAHANPVVADSAGLFDGIYLDGDYKFVLKDSSGVTYWTQDNVNQINAGDILYTLGSTDRTIESKLSDFFHVKDYGAVGDGTTNDTAAIIAACAAVQNNGGGTLLFDPKTYLVYPVGSVTGYNIMNTFTGLDGLVLEGRGATLQFGLNWAVATVDQVVLFYFVSCVNVKISNFSLICTTVPTQVNSISIGLNAFTIGLNCHNYVIENIMQVGGRLGISAVRGTGSAWSTRATKIAVLNYYATDVGYPLSFQNSGDHVFVRNCIINRPGRAYFPYGVRNHDIQIEVLDTYYSPSCLLFAGYGIDTDQGGGVLENIKLDITSIDNTAGTAQATLVGLYMGAKAATFEPAIARNIDVRLNVKMVTGVTLYGVFSIDKQINGIPPNDTVDRGHILENIKISGVIRNAVDVGNIIALNGFQSTWGAGEFVHNLRLEDLYIEGSGTSSIQLNLAPIVDQVQIRNVTVPSAMVITGTPQRGISYQNVVNGTTYYDDRQVFGSIISTKRKLVELAADVASTASTSFQDVTGLSFAVVSGTTYRFFATLLYSTSASTIGIRASLTSPATTYLAYATETGISTTGSAGASWDNYQNTGDQGTASTDSIATTTGNLIFLKGVIKPSANGTVQIRFAPETATASGVVILTGSTLEVW